MRLIITRHGQTEENLKDMTQGQSIPGKLTEKGIEQAQKLAQRLKDEQIDVIYSSDLARAVNTAKEIVKLQADTIPVSHVQELRERSVGELEGFTYDELKLEIPEENCNITKLITEKGESLEQLQTRAQSFLHEILHKHKDKTVLFVAHGGINLALISVIHNKPPSSIKELTRQKNTAVSIFEIDEDKNHRILCFNCTKHLDL